MAFLSISFERVKQAMRSLGLKKIHDRNSMRLAWHEKDCKADEKNRDLQVMVRIWLEVTT